MHAKITTILLGSAHHSWLGTETLQTQSFQLPDSQCSTGKFTITATLKSFSTKVKEVFGLYASFILKVEAFQGNPPLIQHLYQGSDLMKSHFVLSTRIQFILHLKLQLIILKIMTDTSSMFLSNPELPQFILQLIICKIMTDTTLNHSLPSNHL